MSVYDENSFLQGIALGRAMKGVDFVGSNGQFWTGENLLTESQKNLSNWTRVRFQSFQNTYTDGENYLQVTPDDWYDKLYIPVTIHPYTLYVFTGLYRSVTGSSTENYETNFRGERNAILTGQPGQSQLSSYGIIDMSQALYSEASETFRRYSAFAYADIEMTVYLVIDFGKYLDYQPTTVIWKDLCFAQM